MNFWGFTPAVFKQAVELFRSFALENEKDGKAEFYIPSIAEAITKNKTAKFKVLPTSSQWFGVTYKEDKPIVQEKLLNLVEEGIYPDNLYK